MSVVEQRYRAVLAVQAGETAVAVAAQFGVSRQSVQNWLRRYRDDGLAGLVDQPKRPDSSPGQTSVEVEALICEMRREHPRWGARRLVHELERQGVAVPSRVTVHRVLARHGLIQQRPRRRPRSDYRRWERDAPMALWQLDIVGGEGRDDALARWLPAVKAGRPERGPAYPLLPMKGRLPDASSGQMSLMFDDFADERIDVGEVELRVRHAGQGRPVLLIHGHPRTGSTWHRVAPQLVERGFTVVCPDMRGYGQSGKARILPDHSQQSKRAVAADLVRLMNALGHPTFATVGHDRGSYVALRLALDHPDAVSHLVVLDGVPISEALARCDAKFAHDWYHWFFFAQPDTPERVISADPDAWYASKARPESMGAENYQEFRQAIHNAATVRAMLEDYRAGLGVDREHEEADQRAGRTVGCPTLFLWSSRDDMENLYGDPLAVWGAWADDLRGRPIESGHHVAEENPDDLTAALHHFLA